jgi:glutaredoxin
MTRPNRSAMPPVIRLFIKPFCPWCHQATAWLKERDLTFEEFNVIFNAEARREMVRLSGQTYAPVIEVDGRVLADFGADELETWWGEQGFDDR